jgi:hypothetical protein
MKLLACAKCNEPISKLFSIQSSKDPSVAFPALHGGQTVTAQGLAFRSHKPIVQTFKSPKHPLEFSPQLWLNPLDILPIIVATKNLKRLNGCCGWDGMDGPNQVCQCGSEVGTLQNDCWTSHVFIAQPLATIILDEAELVKR